MKLTDGERWILANQYKILMHQVKILDQLSDMEVRLGIARRLDERELDEAERFRYSAERFHEAFLAVGFGVEREYWEQSQLLMTSLAPGTTDLVDEIVDMFEALARGVEYLRLQIEPALWQCQGFHLSDEQPMCCYLDYLVKIKRVKPEWFPNLRSKVPQLARYRRMLEVYRNLFPQHTLNMDGITALIRLNAATT